MLTTRNTGQDILQDINYTYDAVGNIVEIVDNAQQNHYFSNAVTEPRGKYQYDALYRLIKATGRELSSLQMPGHDDFVNTIAMPNTGNGVMQNYTQLFTYDALGNLQNMQSQSRWNRDYVYDTQTNQLIKHDTNQTPPDYTYDAHGNMLTMPHLTGMAWDFQNRLFSATNGTVTSYYNYDATGNRARKTVEKAGNIREERYYIGNYEVYRKFISETLNFERQSLHVSDGTKKFATIETKTIENGEQIANPAPVTRYQYDNHLGSACLELDGWGEIISYEEYHPFGTTSYRSGRTETEVSLKRYKYVGKERDEETGLYYYGARYYAAWIARFISVDPLQHKYPHYTPYQYAGNKPITFIDLDGREEARKVDEIQKIEPKSVSKIETENIKAPDKLEKLNVTGYDRIFKGLKFAGPEELGAYLDFKNEVQKRIDFKNSESPIYERIMGELKTIENETETPFKIRMGDNVTSTKGGGNIRYNWKKKEIDLNIQKFGDWSTIQKLSHELKHAYQYLQQEFDFIWHGRPGESYDLKEEVEAFERLNLFADTNKYPNSYVDNPEQFAKDNYSDISSRTYGLKVFELSDFKNKKMQKENVDKKGLILIYIYKGWSKY